MKVVHKEAATVVASSVKTRAPVGSGRDKHPGRLRNTVRAGSTLTAAVVRVGNASTPYAKPIIFGWPAHNIKPHRFPYVGLDVKRAEVQIVYVKGVEKIKAKAFR